MAKSAKTIFQLGALVMLLIVFPAASWYYLNSGLQYRRSTMAELRSYGHFPLDLWSLPDGSPLDPAFLQKKMLVAHLLPAGPVALADQYGQTLKQLHEQFDERDELVFLSLLPGNNGRLEQQARQFSEAYHLEDAQQLLMVRPRMQEGSSQMETEIFHADPAAAAEPQAFLLLTDTTGTIRRYYDVRQERDIKRLVEHIALLLPLKKDRELIFRREVEK